MVAHSQRPSIGVGVERKFTVDRQLVENRRIITSCIRQSVPNDFPGTTGRRPGFTHRSRPSIAVSLWIIGSDLHLHLEKWVRCRISACGLQSALTFACCMRHSDIFEMLLPSAKRTTGDSSNLLKHRLSQIGADVTHWLIVMVAQLNRIVPRMAARKRQVFWTVSCRPAAHHHRTNSHHLYKLLVLGSSVVQLSLRPRINYQPCHIAAFEILIHYGVPVGPVGTSTGTAIARRPT